MSADAMKLPIAASLRPVEYQPYRVIGVMIRKVRGSLLEITIAARTACPTSRTSRASTPKAGSEIHPRNQIRAANRLLSSQALKGSADLGNIMRVTTSPRPCMIDNDNE
jgi:hypothetical protein